MKWIGALANRSTVMAIHTVSDSQGGLGEVGMAVVFAKHEKILFVLNIYAQLTKNEG